MTALLFAVVTIVVADPVIMYINRRLPAKAALLVDALLIAAAVTVIIII